MTLPPSPDSLGSQPLNAEAIASLTTDALKAHILELVTGQDSLPMGKKVKFLRDRLLPLSVNGQSVNGQWNIENVGIKQVLRIGPEPLSVSAANAWFQDAINAYQQQSSSEQQPVEIPKQGVDSKLEAKYKKIAKAKPQLAHLYIDQDFRLVKTVREKTQRPSYTIATRLIETAN